MFTIHTARNAPYTVWLETAEIRVCVGELSKARKGSWEFHFAGASSNLAVATYDALRKFGTEQATLLTVKDRLTQ